MIVRRTHVIAAFLGLGGLSALAYGQDAQIHGQITDSSGNVIQQASVRVVDQQTSTERKTQSNALGDYVVSGLTPSQYKVFAAAPGFSVSVSNVITLNVGQNATLDFSLKVGSTSTEITVNGDSASINTSDASVSTVIDRDFVRDMPLNGRSFQTLILLSPGVVTNTPQGNDDGGFSVNGQRTSANRYQVDGVSAQNGAYVWGGTASSGMAASSTALGTTQSILPVDAIQEFRISTSTYSAEYGRQPGAQISIQSRSGTNTYHGDVYEYLRNYVFDANDWMNTHTKPAIPRPAERQNDFGGAFGGPLGIPRVFSGKNRLFVFGAYEGLRLTLPQNATIYYVPSNGTLNTATYSNPKYMNLRANVPAALQPIMNAFPLPNCPPAQNSQCVDHGDGLSPYIFSGAWPARSNTYNARVDFQATESTRIFARYADTPSVQTTHITDAPFLEDKLTRNRVYVLGANSAIRGSLVNDLRLQYSPSSYILSSTQDLTGGARPANLNTLQGLPAVGGESFFEFDFNEQSKYYALNYGTLQFQRNAVDNVTWTHNQHIFKAGVDYRTTTVRLDDGALGRAPGAFTYFTTSAQLLANQTYEIKTNNAARQDLTSKNLGLFLQDEWRIHPRLTLSLGLRWDFNPAPTVNGEQQYTYAGNINRPATLALSALGAPFYGNRYRDFQPRAGAAWVIRNQPGFETVLRAGGGLFYDLIAANEFVGNASSSGYGNNQLFNSSAKMPFPIPAAVIEAPATYPPATPYTLAFLIDPHVVNPSAVHWNVSLEQGLGSRQRLTLGYVGSAGMNLIHETEYSLSKLNPLFTTITQYQNGPGSSYNALQTQYRRDAFLGLQVLGSYTWSHSIDWSSNDTAIEPMQKGNSNHDVRHNFTAALVYNVPTLVQNRLAKAVTSNWNIDLMTAIRSGFPVEQAGANVVDPATGNDYASTLNYNGGNPYLYLPGAPGGRQFNPAVFSVPATGTTGNAPRNFLRGFGEAVADLSIQRTFPLYERFRLQLRAEAFNLLNHPNFGALNLSCGVSTAGAACNNPLMGQATSTLSTALSGNTGPPGMASLYQQGGPRSLQFAVKLQF